jgi:hypothetical protein
MAHKNTFSIFACSAFVLLATHGGGSASPGAAQQTKAYQYASLKGLSNEKLFEYMGKGPSVGAREWAERNRRVIPEDFWDTSPRDAALALLAATQTTVGKQRYSVAIGKPKGGPPSKGTLVFSDYSDRSYSDARRHYFVRFSPEGSFFAYAMTLSPGQVGYDITQVETAYDLRSCELTHGEARHIAQVIWWLGWAETKEKAAEPASSGMTFGDLSSADGRGHLSLVPEDGGKALNETGTLSAMAPGNWGGEYDRETYLNVAGFAVEGILFERLSKKWPEAASGLDTRYLGISRGYGDYTRDELSGLKEGILLFLKLYTPDGRRISHRHVLAAAQAAGDLALTEAAPLLEGVRKNLPPPSPAGKKGGRTLEEIMKEVEKLRTSTDLDKFMDKADEIMEEYLRVQGEMDSGAGIEKELEATVATALRKIETADDVPALTKWARNRDPGSTWAASRLLKKSASAYADVLADWLDRARPEYKSQILHAIYRAFPQKALEIAAKVPPGGKSELSTAAAEILEKSGALSGDKDRVASLIQVALDKKADWKERNKAIDLLVPRDNPGKFPGEAIDDALITLVETETSKGFMLNFTLTAAARALAWRNRVDQLDTLIRVLADQNSDGMSFLSGSLLSAVTYVARKGKEAELKKLARIIAPHFKRTNWQITEILWSAWAADLREFKSDVERIATASPTDEEGRKASSSGGEVTEVNERYHLARKIAALWNEEDLLTRGKLLIAFGFSEAYEIVEAEALERGEHMKEVLAALAREATPADLSALGEFMTWSENTVVRGEPEPVYRERMEAFARLARGILY